MSLAVGMALAERGLVPLGLARAGIRGLLRQRLAASAGMSHGRTIEALDRSPVAIETARANTQHYELPAGFFELVLGPRLKYSAGFWPAGVGSLAESEEAALELVVERARIADGQTILDLGCGWGSLTGYLATRFPRASIVAVSNSAGQATFIRAKRHRNVEVLTDDINRFDPGRCFDRIVSIEMLEHVRNYRVLFRRLSSWLAPGGSLFTHVFCHRRYTYPFETEGAGNWMGRYFFTGGLMPSAGLFREFADELVVDDDWVLDGTHYRRTAAAWRRNLELQRRSIMPVLRSVYGAEAARWYHRWRLFFLACEELFGYAGGSEWMVSHARFVRRAGASEAA
ncbi:MAG: cyclopropane-fatty-acyl-phospholipid synthase family protein [Gemmatimonadales bacterium]